MEEGLINIKERKKSINNSLKFTGFESIRKGFSERYIEAFASFLNATPFQFSILVSLPQFIGGIFQLYIINILAFFKKRKKLTITITILQGIVLIPFILLPFSNSIYKVWYYILFVCIYFILTLMHSPIWNSWLMDLVIEEKRGRYIAIKSKVIDLVTMISFISGGIILNNAKISGQNLDWAFAGLFGIASISGLIASFYLKKIKEPNYTIIRPKISINKFIKSMKTESQGIIVLYLSLMSFSVFIASPFYTPYLLQTLKFNYIQFVLLWVFPFITRILFAKRIGRVIDKYGPKNTLKVVSLAMALNPLLWLVDSSFGWLVVAQLYAGLSYGAYEISALSFFINGTNSKNRISLFSYYTFFNGVFILLGALFSNLVIKIGPFNNLFMNAFFFSGVLRLLILFIKFPRKIKEKDYYSPTSYQNLSKHIFALDYPRELLSKFVAAKEMIALKPMDNEIVTKLSTGNLIKIKKQATIITNIKPNQKKTTIKKENKKIPKYLVYLCSSCNAEFKRDSTSKTKLCCPYCNNQNVIFLRGNENKKRMF